MRYPTHTLIGLTGVALAARITGLEGIDAAVAGFGGVVGSWLPDVDAPGSRIHRRTVLERGNANMRLVGTLVRIPLRLMPLVFRHRGWTHSAVATAIVAAAALALLPRPLALGLTLGYALHLIADMATPSGLQLWLPLRRQVWLLPKRRRIRTGSARELLVAAGALTALVAVTFA